METALTHVPFADEAEVLLLGQCDVRAERLFGEEGHDTPRRAASCHGCGRQRCVPHRPPSLRRVAGAVVDNLLVVQELLREDQTRGVWRMEEALTSYNEIGQRRRAERAGEDTHTSPRRSPVQAVGPTNTFRG
jgi:hypothetical protein